MTVRNDHKVLFALRNPFKKKAPFAPTGPQLVWATRQHLPDEGRGIPATKYLLLLYGFNGRVKRHFEFLVFDRKQRP